MTLDEITKEAESFLYEDSFFKDKHLTEPDEAIAFAMHCVDKATGWQPIADLADEDLPVWFYEDGRIWVGTKTFDDGWIYTHCHGTHYFNGEFWTCTYAEFDYDYKPTHFQHLPPPPEAA